MAMVGSEFSQQQQHVLSMTCACRDDVEYYQPETGEAVEVERR
jgi:hypothetical protein